MSEFAISVVNLKGGVGKTTTSIILTELALLHKKKKVLAIDLDPQRNFLDGLSYVSGYFENRLRIKTELNSDEDEEAPEDWIIIDCPPRIDDENVKKAMIFSDMVLIPVKADIFSVLNLTKVFEAANSDKSKAHNQLPIIKVGFDGSKISRYAEDILFDYNYPVIGEIPLFKHIPYNIAKGRIWSVGLTAVQRNVYIDIIDRISNAFDTMKDGNFEQAWGEYSVKEDFDEELDESQELNENHETETENKKQFSENRFIGN